MGPSSLLAIILVRSFVFDKPNVPQSTGTDIAEPTCLWTRVNYCKKTSYSGQITFVACAKKCDLRRVSMKTLVFFSFQM